MKFLGFPLKAWLKHPILVWNARRHNQIRKELLRDLPFCEECKNYHVGTKFTELARPIEDTFYIQG